MNRFYQIRRMRGAVFLILVGVLALLNQRHILSWGQSWPLFLILLGVLMLAERAAWMADLRDRQAEHNLGAIPSGPVSSPYVPCGAGYEHRPAPENPNREER